jgi:type III secretion system regulator LcrR
VSVALLQEDAPATMGRRAAIVAALRAEGLEVEEICAAGDPVPTPFTVAHRFVRDGHRLTFRVVEPHWVLISMYERLGAGPTLRDPFTTMAWFVHWLRWQRLGIQYVLGRVETGPFRKGHDLDDDRLLRYYLRWGGAEVVPLEAVPGLSWIQRRVASLQGIRYVRVGVPDFRMPKDRARARWRAPSRSRNEGR